MENTCRVKNATNLQYQNDIIILQQLEAELPPLKLEIISSNKNYLYARNKITMKNNLLYLIIISSLSFTTQAQNDVITWVPTYALASSKKVLQSSFGDVAVKDALTQVGLQFWNIHTSGTVKLIDVNETDVQWFTTWGKQSNIKILLTVVNFGTQEFGYNGFDWRLVRKACYGTRGDTMIINLLKEVDYYDLDGIDLDFEGESSAGGPFTDEDATQYAVFVNKLCDSLHARNKICTSDSYPFGPWGCPLPSWWSQWKTIDAIHGMGYTSTYWNATAEKSYQGQQNLAIAAGISPEKYMLGMPMWVDNWSGASNNIGVSNIDNLNYILNCLHHKTGIALWDIHTPETFIAGTTIRPWSSDTVWKLIKAIKTGISTNPLNCPDSTINPKIIDDMRFSGSNIRGGLWTAFSDYYARAAADKENSTKVLTTDKLFDLALQYGSYGEIWPGYEETPEFNNALNAEIQTISLAGTSNANAGFTMHFLPVDLSLDSTAAAWETAKVGVEQDLSAFQKLVVGAQCTAGKKIRIYLQNKSGAKVYAAPYGLTFNCTGNYEDYELPFATLPRLWGTGSGFDASHCLKLSIDFSDASPPDTVAVSIIGVAVDTSVVGIKNIHTSIASSEHNAFSFSIYPNPAQHLIMLDINTNSTNINANNTIEIINTLGQTVFYSTINSTNEEVNSRYTINLTSIQNGLYFVKINNTIKKIVIQH